MVGLVPSNVITGGENSRNGQSFSDGSKNDKSVQEAVIKTITKKKKCEKAKWLSNSCEKKT